MITVDFILGIVLGTMFSFMFFVGLHFIHNKVDKIFDIHLENF